MVVAISRVERAAALMLSGVSLRALTTMWVFNQRASARLGVGERGCVSGVGADGETVDLVAGAWDLCELSGQLLHLSPELKSSS